MIDDLSDQLYPEHRERAIEEFTTQCLQRFYLENQNVVLGSLSLREEACGLTPGHPSAAVVFAFASIETLLKSVLLRPIIAGLVRRDSFANLLYEFLVGGRTDLDRLHKLLFRIVIEHCRLDLRSFKRPGANALLWQELKNTEAIRNGILHKAEVASAEQCETAIALADFALDELFTRVLDSVALHLHGLTICSEPTRKICADKPLPALPTIPPKPSPTLSELREYFRSQEAYYWGLENALFEIDSDTIVISGNRLDYLANHVPEFERLASNFYRRQIVVKLEPR
jgi:hypothetical protein